ncbi:hypothetical protein JHK86_000030 [Glycine max]|nr:hypothetical protein JHK86_000030 [Glycine max]
MYMLYPIWRWNISSISPYNLKECSVQLQLCMNNSQIDRDEEASLKSMGLLAG